MTLQKLASNKQNPDILLQSLYGMNFSVRDANREFIESRTWQNISRKTKYPYRANVYLY